MCCCCSLRTHTKVIAIICIILTALGALNLIGTVGAFNAGTTDAVTTDALLFYGGDMGIALAVQIPIYVFCIVSDVLCLFGAIKSNKCFLVPFIVKMVLLIIADVVIVILFIILGANAGSLIAGSTNDRDMQNVVGTFGAMLFFLLLIPLLIGIGIAIYFLVIVVRYFKEISSDMVTNSEPSSQSRTEFSTLRMDSIVTHAPVWRGGKYVCSNQIE